MFNYLISMIKKNIILNTKFISLLLIVFACGPLFAHEIVNISSYDDNGFYILNDNQNVIGGYAFDLQSGINRYLNWDVQYILGDWKECQVNVLNGKTDLLFGVFKTEERMKDYCFNNIPIAVVTNYVCSRANSESLNDDYSKMSGKTVGLIDGAISSNKFKKFLDDKQINVNYVLGTSSKDLREKLKDHKIDYLILNTNIYEDEKAVQKFSQEPMYIMANKNNKYLLDEIDDAISRLKEVDPDVLHMLFSKTYTNKAQKLENLLNKEEICFIKKAKSLRCGVINNIQPYYYKSINNEDIGLIVSIVEKISQESGINVVFVPFNDRESELKALENGEIDMLSNMPNNFHTAQKYNLNLSIPYLETQMSVIKNQKSSPQEKAKNVYAIPYQIINHSEEIMRNISNIKIKYYPTPQTCIDALNRGEVSGSIIENFTVLQNKGELKNTKYLVSFPASGIYVSHCFAFSSKCSFHYIDIFDKSISSLDTTEISFSLIDKEQSVNSKNLVRAFFVNNRYVFLTLIILVLFSVCFLYFSKKRALKKNDELNLANNKSREASKAKSEFLANMSHELRTPLNAIIGLNTLLKDSLDDRALSEDYIAKIHQSSKMLLIIINDILDMSAIESGKIKIANEKFSIKKMIYSVTNIYYQQCRDRGIDLKFNIGKIEYESLVGDSYRIRQVLLNFLSNSVKFTEKGGTIEVFLDEEVRRDGIILTFSVSDNGCGMDEDLQKRLFHKFEQQNATTVRKYGGSGLGLSICHKLVELMEGEISVVSQKGIGTAFTVQIPLEKGSSPIDIALNDIKGLKVLIVDEDEITCKYLSSVFFKWNINNDYCTSSNSAIEKVKNNNSYSLYIIDMKMPKINGVELITELRNITKVDSTIIIMSGYDIDEKILISKNIDLKRFVRKPVFSTELYYTIIGDWGRDAIEQDSDNIRLENINVLLVEDNKMNQLIASRIIEKKGAVVDTCNNGQEAVKIIQEKKVLYDVVLMDIQMPIMNGYEATRIIRSIDDEYAKNILIYAMTASSFNSDVQKASDIGMNGHISKPIDTKTLFKILSKIKQNK